MNPSELKAVLSVGTLYVFRMLGLFMVLPVLPLYGSELNHATPLLIGVALGVYGISQALLQIPFGFMSDRWGRKRMIVIGLLLFIFGSVVAAVSESIYGIILGRLLQGAGAIASTMMALLSDLTRVEQRTKAMAILGISIGLSFLFAMILGPLIDRSLGLSGIFWTTALLGTVGLVILLVLVPEPERKTGDPNSKFVGQELRKVIATPGLLRLAIGIFILHFNLVASFSGFPLILEQSAVVSSDQHHYVYGGLMILSFLGIAPLMMLADRANLTKWVFMAAALSMVASHMLLVQANGYWLLAAMFLFFMPFNLMEVSLPSSLSKLAPAATRGTAMGVYSTLQFMGAAFGGIVGGLILQVWDLSVLFEVNALICLLWALSFISMTRPRFLKSKVLDLGAMDEVAAIHMKEALSSLAGVEEMVIIKDIAYLKIDEEIFDEAEIESLVTES